MISRTDRGVRGTLSWRDDPTLPVERRGSTSRGAGNVVRLAAVLLLTLVLFAILGALLNMPAPVTAEPVPEQTS